MEVKIIGRHLQVFEPIREYAEQKIGKLERFFDQIQHIELILSIDGKNKVAEMHIKSRVGGVAIGEERHEDMYAAIDLLIDKMSRQLKKQKEKLKVNHHKSGRRPSQGDGVEGDEEDLETYDEIVQKTYDDIAPRMDPL